MQTAMRRAETAIDPATLRGRATNESRSLGWHACNIY
jgi:hypothetical protein